MPRISPIKSIPFLNFSRDRLRSTLGITYGRGSFAVSGSFAVGDHLRYCTVLIFTSFRIFPSAIRKNKFPQKIIKRKHFSRKNLLQSIKYTLTKIYYTKNRTKKSCLFNYNSPPQFRNKTVYNELVLNGVFYSFNPRRTMTRSHISRNRDFLESISF